MGWKASFGAGFDISLIALSALLYTIALPPFDWFIAGWIALAPLLIAVRGVSSWRAFIYGSAFGIAICAGVAYWLLFAIAHYFAAPFPVAMVLGGAAYFGFVGIYTGLFAAGAAVLMRSKSSVVKMTAIPALWVTGEFARSCLFGGFSWGLLGYSQHSQLGLIQIADLTGIYGVSFLLAAAACAIAQITNASDSLTGSLPWRETAGLAALLAAVVVYGQWRLTQFASPSDDKLTVALVERQTPAEERWSRVGYVHALLEYDQRTRQSVAQGPVDLIVWPEFATGSYLDRDPLLRLQLSRLTEQAGAPLLLGGPRYESVGGQVRYFNSAYLIASSGRIVDTYDKIRLLPFAEYRPLDLPSVSNRGDAEIPSEFSPGVRETIFSIPKGKFGVMICFEVTYPEFARHLARAGANFLVNISNDAWLSAAGGRAAAVQHFATCVFRAIENRRGIARVTTAGVTGFIEPSGFVHGVDAGVDVAEVGRLTLRQGMSVYTRFGDWFAYVCVIYSLMAIAGALVLKYRGLAS